METFRSTSARKTLPFCNVTIMFLRKYYGGSVHLFEFTMQWTTQMLERQSCRLWWFGRRRRPLPDANARVRYCESTVGPSWLERSSAHGTLLAPSSCLIGPVDPGGWNQSRLISSWSLHRRLSPMELYRIFLTGKILLNLVWIYLLKWKWMNIPNNLGPRSPAARHPFRTQLLPAAGRFGCFDPENPLLWWRWSLLLLRHPLERRLRDCRTATATSSSPSCELVNPGIKWNDFNHPLASIVITCSLGYHSGYNPFIFFYNHQSLIWMGIIARSELHSHLLFNFVFTYKDSRLETKYQEEFREERCIISLKREDKRNRTKKKRGGGGREGKTKALSPGSINPWFVQSWLRLKPSWKLGSPVD